jgi:alpha-mannosidase
MLHDLSYLPRQTKRRIEAWKEELARHIYIPLQPLAWEGFVTYEHLSHVEAAASRFTEFPSGTRWGAKAQYGWFRSSFTLEKEHTGRTLCSPIGVGGEMLVYCDGKAAGSIDRHHHLVFFSFDARAGKHSLLVESYAGSGALLEGGGPVPPARSVYPQVPQAQQQIQNATVGYIEEAVYQLHMDVNTLLSLLSVLESTSLQAEHIVQALVEFTKIVDFEGTDEKLVATCRQARSLLAPVLAYTNGSCVPTFSVFGQSHIDLAWKWTVDETKRKCGRTYANQLTLLRQYPQYTFLLCEPSLVELLKTHHPAIHSEVMDLVRKKRIIAEGAFWVESDTNLPDAESLAKQLIKGQQWFAQQTGSIATFGWLPDTFGFSASLPQLLVQAGVESFGTQKLLRADPESDTFPFTDFWWEGEDGTRILSNMCYRNNCEITAEQLYQRWHVDRKQHENIEALLYPFGYGDGGGGPDRDLVESMMRLINLQGLPRLTFEGPKQYFDRIRERVTNVHKGELYLAWHRGTYSSQQRLKQLNTVCENALREYAYWATARDAFDRNQYERWWETVLFNQFHDILAGVSIKEVNQQAEAELDRVLLQCRSALQGILQAESDGDEKTFTVFNSTSEAVKTWIRLPLTADVFLQGTKLATYHLDGATWALADLQVGTTVLQTRTIEESDPAVECKLVEKLDAGFRFSDGSLSFLVDETGEISDLRCNNQLICPCAHALRLYQDINADYDAWELSKISLTMEPQQPIVRRMYLAVNTSFHAALVVEQQIGNSTVNQVIHFTRQSQQIDIEMQVDWQERHKLLKSTLNHSLQTDQYFCDTQLGYKRMNLHRNTTSDRDRYEVCAQRYATLGDERFSLSLINSYPFGLCAHHNQVGITLLRSALIPDDRGEAGLHTLRFALSVTERSFSGLAAKQDAVSYAHCFPLVRGTAKFEAPFELRKGGAILTVLERTEEGLPLLRLSNPGRKVENVCFIDRLGTSRAWECNLLGEQEKALKKSDAGYEIVLPPFALRTIRFSLEKAKNAKF